MNEMQGEGQLQGEEQPLLNTVVLPQPLQENQCFFCQQDMNATTPLLELLCHCKFHTACFLDRRFFFDEDANHDIHEDAEFHVRNNCPRCHAQLLDVTQILQRNDLQMDQIVDRIGRRRIRRRSSSSFLEIYTTNKEAKKDFRAVKKTLSALRKSFGVYEKKKKQLSVEFHNETRTLVEMLKQIQKQYLEKVERLEEKKMWRSARSKFLYAQRKFSREYKLQDFYLLCRIRELRLPSRWRIYKLLSGGRWYRRRSRLFGVYI